MGFLVGLGAVSQAERRDLVVDKAPHRLGMLDPLPVQAHSLSHLRVPAQVEAKGAQPHFAGSPKAVGLAARNPKGRMGFLHRLGNDRARRDLVEAPLVGEGVLRPHARNHANGFFPLGSGLLRIDLEAVHLAQGRGPPGAEIHTAITDDIEYGGTLSYPYRMVILTRQEGYRVANANALGALGEGPVEDFRGRAVGKFPQEVVLYRPEVRKADLVSQFHLGHHLLVALLLDTVIVGFWHLDFIHEPKLHDAVLRMRSRAILGPEAG